MRTAYSQIAASITQRLEALGLPAATPGLTPTEPPRAWGVSTNICFTLAPKAAEALIAEATAGLSKPDAKKAAAQIARKAGEDLAARLAESLQDGIGRDEFPFVERIEADGAYVNFFYDAPLLGGTVVGLINAMGDSFGEGIGSARVPAGEKAGTEARPPEDKRIMVEFAQPNTHKDFHVGHLRNASIGMAIANLLEFQGNDVKKATYIGDVGAHVAKYMLYEALRKESQSYLSIVRDWAQGLVTELDELLALQSLPIEGGHVYEDGYRAGNRYLKQMEILKEMGEHTPQAAQSLAQDWLKRWEQGEQVARSEWQSTRDYYVGWFKDIFAELLVTFDDDCWFYESVVDDTHMGQQAAKELLARGIAKVDESAEYRGSVFVDFEEQSASPVFSDEERKKVRRLGKMVILRSDGTSLYQTKELALARYKFENFKIDESLYVVGAEQRLYFEQVFAILRLWGFPNAQNCRHISYELVVLPEGKMSSREGTVVSYRELRDEAIRRAEGITREKGIAGDIGQTARDIALAAIKFAMLQVSGSQQITFDFEQALSFDGRSAPYLQYAYARAGKLVAGLDDSAVATAPEHPLLPAEEELIRQLSIFPSVCRSAAERCEPALLCTYLYGLAGSFSDFYRDCRVLDAPAEEKLFRQRLCTAFRQVLRTGFRLLALPLPEEM